MATRSIAGVGITPPKVLGTPKPASSVMISSTLGAPCGGVIRGAHQGFDCRAPSLITPPKAGAGTGSWVPGIVVVALGAPSVPVIFWARAGASSGPPISSANAIRTAVEARHQRRRNRSEIERRLRSMGSGGASFRAQAIEGSL